MGIIWAAFGCFMGKSLWTCVASLAKIIHFISFLICSGMCRGSLYCESINLLIPPKGCGLVLQSFSSSITSFLICALGVLGDSSKGALRVWLQSGAYKTSRHLPEKWNVFIFSPEKEMVFLAENFEVKQSCVYKIPGVLVWNWGALHQVLFCWNQNIGWSSALQGDTVPPLIWGGRSLGASLCLVLFFCFAPLSFLAFPALLEILFILPRWKSVWEYTHQKGQHCSVLWL